MAQAGNKEAWRWLDGPELAALMKVGSRVKRGRSWGIYAPGNPMWRTDMKDGKECHGTVTKFNHGLAYVDWDNGDSGAYDMGGDGQYDLDLVNLPQ